MHLSSQTLTATQPLKSKLRSIEYYSTTGLKHESYNDSNKF